MDILQHENRLKREKYAWAYAAETKAKQDRLRLEQSRRQLLIENGGYVPDDGLVVKRKAIEPPTHRLALVAPKEGSSDDQGKQKAIEGPETDQVEGTSETSDALVQRNDTTQDDRSLVRHAPSLNAPDISETQLAIPNALPVAMTPANDPTDEGPVEIALDPSSHLARALANAGLPETAIVTRQGDLVPGREIASGSGVEGDAERKEREEREKRVMGELKDTRETLVPTWGYKVSSPA
jgi:protein DGCR14